ncbi:cupin-like domain-containing protein [Pseudomonas sp. S3_G06]
MILNSIPRVISVSRRKLSAYLAEPEWPLIVTRGMDCWPAMQRWDLDYFASRFSDFPIIAFAPQFEELANWGVRTDLRAYAAYLRNPSKAEIDGVWIKGDPRSFKESGQILYSGNFNPANLRYGQPDNIFRDVPEMPGFIDSWLPLLDQRFVETCRRIQPHFFVYLSAPGAWTPLHADFWDTHAFLAQICGSKRAYLFHPNHTDLLMSDSTRDVRLMCCDEQYASIEGWVTELHRGDLLIIPSRWLHFVETLEFSITYSADWVDAVNWRSYVTYGNAVLQQRGISF